MTAVRNSSFTLRFDSDNEQLESSKKMLVVHKYTYTMCMKYRL
jgi:hypothetical protein